MTHEKHRTSEAVPEGCIVKPYSSAGCSRGTHGCEVFHGVAGTTLERTPRSSEAVARCSYCEATDQPLQPFGARMKCRDILACIGRHEKLEAARARSAEAPPCPHNFRDSTTDKCSHCDVQLVFVNEVWMPEPRAVVLDEVTAELARARAKFPRRQASAHEGFAVLDEERDELWDEVKANHPDRKARMRAEAIQVAAMAIRFIEDVCDAT